MSEVTSEQRTGTGRGRRSPLAHLLLLPITIYRWTAPLRAPRCRFYPSCSSYAVEAIRVHGALRGAWLGARRLLRCHPWNDGGVDHVPPRRPASPSVHPATTRVRPPGTPPISSRK